MEVRPNYYDTFKCIADKCKHNCCIGWEIDIDQETLRKYNAQTGKLGEKLQKNIAFNPCAHFILAENDRCPFLNEQNLCELILECGEDMLCQICSDHPRFYNQFNGFYEKGLGLSCEAAAKLILENEQKFKLIADDEIIEDEFYAARDEIFKILQSKKPINDRVNLVLNNINAPNPLNKTDWVEFYKNLERLDTCWDEYLNSTPQICDEIPKNLEKCCENLLCYFIYRHLSEAIDDFLFLERIQFAILSCYVIVSVNKTKTVEEMLEVARIYSAEIEYSDKNVEILLEKLYEINTEN